MTTNQIVIKKFVASKSTFEIIVPDFSTKLELRRFLEGGKLSFKLTNLDELNDADRRMLPEVIKEIAALTSSKFNESTGTFTPTARQYHTLKSAIFLSCSKDVEQNPQRQFASLSRKLADTSATAVDEDGPRRTISVYVGTIGGEVKACAIVHLTDFTICVTEDEVYVNGDVGDTPTSYTVSYINAATKLISDVVDDVNKNQIGRYCHTFKVEVIPLGLGVCIEHTDRDVTYTDMVDNEAYKTFQAAVKLEPLGGDRFSDVPSPKLSRTALNAAYKLEELLEVQVSSDLGKFLPQVVANINYIVQMGERSLLVLDRTVGGDDAIQLCSLSLHGTAFGAMVAPCSGRLAVVNRVINTSRHFMDVVNSKDELIAAVEKFFALENAAMLRAVDDRPSTREVDRKPREYSDSARRAQYGRGRRELRMSESITDNESLFKVIDEIEDRLMRLEGPSRRR